MTEPRIVDTTPPPDDGYVPTTAWDAPPNVLAGLFGLAEDTDAHHQRHGEPSEDDPTNRPTNLDVDADVAVVHTLIAAFPREEVLGKVRRHLTRYTDRQRDELFAAALIALADEQSSHAGTGASFEGYVEQEAEETAAANARIDQLTRERDAFCTMFNTLHLGVSTVLEDAFETEDSVRHGRSTVADVRLLVAQRDAARAEVERLSALLGQDTPPEG